MTITTITFLHDIIPDFVGIHVFSNPRIWLLHFWDILEVSQFLNKLECEKTYVISLQLINLHSQYIEGDPAITLTNPFIICKDSDPILISDYISDQLIKTCETFTFEDNQINNPKVLVKFTEINLDCF